MLRRSLRLAAKDARNSYKNSPFSLEQARLVFISEIGKTSPISDHEKVVCIIDQYFEDYKTSRGAIRKAVVCLNLLQFLLHQPIFLAHNISFANSMYNGLVNINQYEIPDSQLQEDVLLALEQLRILIMPL